MLDDTMLKIRENIANLLALPKTFDIKIEQGLKYDNHPYITTIHMTIGNLEHNKIDNK